MEEEKMTTISIPEKKAKVYRRMFAKAGLGIIEGFSMLATEISKIMDDGIEQTERINFMIDADLKNSMVHLRFSPLYTMTELPLEVQKMIKKGFDYGEHGEDLREKKEVEK